MKKERIYKSAGKHTELLAQAEASFTEFFTAYYEKNRKVKNIRYFTMENNIGYCAVVEFQDFTQYYNYYVKCPLMDINSMVNSCFELADDGHLFLCHFTDILDAADSDDISFYTYPKSPTDEAMKKALGAITAATEQHYDEIVRVKQSEALVKEIAEFYFDGSEYLTKVEDAFDPDYFDYGVGYAGTDELRKYLVRQKKKGRLEEGYETRAYRVYANMSREERRTEDKKQKKNNDYSKRDKLYMYLPPVAAMVLFGAGFAVLGIHLDKTLYADWIGKSHLETGFPFGIIGVMLGLIFADIISVPLYKLIIPKHYYDDFMLIAKSESASKALTAVAYTLGIIVCAILFAIFAFRGTAVTESGEILHKDFAFSAVETYQLKDTDTVIVRGYYDDDGFNEYGETAYAFCLGDGWEDFGIPNGEAKKIIETSLRENNVKPETVDSVDDLDEESLVSRLKKLFHSTEEA